MNDDVEALYKKALSYLSVNRNIPEDVINGISMNLQKSYNLALVMVRDYNISPAKIPTPIIDCIVDNENTNFSSLFMKFLIKRGTIISEFPARMKELRSKLSNIDVKSIYTDNTPPTDNHHIKANNTLKKI